MAEIEYKIDFGGGSFEAVTRSQWIAHQENRLMNGLPIALGVPELGMKFVSTTLKTTQICAHHGETVVVYQAPQLCPLCSAENKIEELDSKVQSMSIDLRTFEYSLDDSRADVADLESSLEDARIEIASLEQAVINASASDAEGSGA